MTIKCLFIKYRSVTIGMTTASNSSNVGVHMCLTKVSAEYSICLIQVIHCTRNLLQSKSNLALFLVFLSSTIKVSFNTSSDNN